ncbi:hypothetical protein Smp_060610 [Schistosoma mansoni]|nr:hypothetical protein Smp_060610 [Schistosoma mansoni]|eukprot:XP_018648659.1 hypothetical protein Smp_060610 [Schistosoma mansoni]
MMEFWKLAHKALVDGNVSRNDIDGCVLEGGIVLRLVQTLNMVLSIFHAMERKCVLVRVGFNTTYAKA